MSALLVGPDERLALALLRAQAEANPIDVRAIKMLLTTSEGAEQHMARMTAQTVVIPVGFHVTFSLESGHPAGLCRHMSISNHASRTGSGTVPTPDAAWLVAVELGFVDDPWKTVSWIEEFTHRGLAVNLVQPVSAAVPLDGETA